MTELEPLPQPSVVYEYRGFEGEEPLTPRERPFHQGDIFRDIDIPGIDNPDRMAMLFLHPCTMRDKGSLIDRVTVVAVRKFPTKAGGVPGYGIWGRGHYDKMPLYEMEGEGGELHCAHFLELGTVASADLQRAKRVATLSIDGRLHLLHRITNHFTRLRPSTKEFRAATKGVESEWEAQMNWVEAACGAAEYDARKANQEFNLDQAIVDAETEVTTWMDEPEQRRRLRGGELHEIQEVVSEAALESERRHARPRS